MAEKAPMIVIKKITIAGGGGHGGAWKVAFADFMTAMMAFFLVMWLLATSSEPSKKAISDYFSTPSIIEYQFNNFGVELTLEKLFLDLVSEPLKVFQSFVTPVDRTPNMMAMGMKKIVYAYMAEQLGSNASNVNVTGESVTFEIPDSELFVRGTANPNANFVPVMEQVKGVTQGLEDVDLVLTSVVYKQSVAGQNPREAKAVAEERLDMVQAKVKAALESPSVELTGKAFAGDEAKRSAEAKKEASKAGRVAAGGYIKVEIKQKLVLPDGRKPPKLSNGIFGAADSDKSVYDNFVTQVSQTKHNEKSTKRDAAKSRSARAETASDSDSGSEAPSKSESTEEKSGGDESSPRDSHSSASKASELARPKRAASPETSHVE